MTRRYLRVEDGRIDVNTARHWDSPTADGVLYLSASGEWVFDEYGQDPIWIERPEAARILGDWGHDFPIDHLRTGRRMGRPPRSDDPTVANIVLPGAVYRTLVAEATRLGTTRSNVVTSALRKHLGIKEQ
jgi:hypothetical protein